MAHRLAGLVTWFTSTNVQGTFFKLGKVICLRDSVACTTVLCKLSCARICCAASMFCKVSNLTVHTVQISQKGVRRQGQHLALLRQLSAFRTRSGGSDEALQAHQNTCTEPLRLVNLPLRTAGQGNGRHLRLLNACAQRIHDSASGDSLLVMHPDIKPTPGVSVWNC